MAFDAIETTVANALLLRAQMGESEPIIIPLKSFHELQTYSQTLLKEMTLSSLLQEPLGKYFFNLFLKENEKEGFLQICTEIRSYSTAIGKSRRRRGINIILRLCEGTEWEAKASLAVATLASGRTAHSEANNSTQDADIRVKIDAASEAKKGNSGNALGEVKVYGEMKKIDFVSEKQNSDELAQKSGQNPTVPKKEAAMELSKLSINDKEKAIRSDSNEDEKIMIKPEFLNHEKAMANIALIDDEGEKPAHDELTGSVMDASTVEKTERERSISMALMDHSNEQKSAFEIPLRAIEILAKALPTPEVLETEDLMETMDFVYACLYTKLAKEWFAKFLASGKLYENFIRNREYAETSKVGFNEFQMFRALGKGAFGMVSAVQKKDTKKIYAMKQMSKKKIKHFHSEKLCEIEKAALQKVDSPFVLNLKYSFAHDKSLFLILALCNGGDLQFHLQEVRGHRFSEGRAQFYAAEVILALEHLHKRKFVYRDLKPGNILLEDSGHIVLSDLGLVHRVSSKRPLRTLAGTAGYWAPEVMRRQVYDYTADWWSFGVFVHKLLSGRRPKCDCKKPKQWCPFGTKKDHPDSAKANEPMTFDLIFDDVCFSPLAQDLLRKLLEPDATKRLGANGAEEVKRHPFFADISWSELLEKEVEPPFKPTKNDVNAVSLGEISSEGDRKFKKISTDSQDDKFYERWEYKSIRTIQEEIVQALERNAELEKNPPKKPTSKDESKNCCTIL